MRRILLVLIALSAWIGAQPTASQWNDVRRKIYGNPEASDSLINQGLWEYTQGIQSGSNSTAKDSLYIAAANSTTWDKARAHNIVTGDADDEIAAALTAAGTYAYVRILPGTYTLTNNTAATSGIKITNDYVTLDASGAVLTLANSENVFLVELDSTIGSGIIGGTWKGNQANQTSGGGIKFTQTTDAFIMYAVVDSVRTHSIQPSGTYNTLIFGNKMRYSNAGRGVDVEWESAEDDENQGLKIIGNTIEDHGFGTIKVENSWETLVVGNLLYGREPDASGVNTIIVENNDAAADTLDAVEITGNLIKGGNSIFIKNVNGSVKISDNRIQDTYIALEDTCLYTRIIDNEFYPDAGDESRFIDAKSDHVGVVDITGNEMHAVGSVSRGMELEGDGQYIVERNRIYNMANRGIILIGQADSAIVRDNLFVSNGGHGGSEIAIDVQTNYNDISDNHIRNFRWGIYLTNSDSNRVADNFISDKSANADSAIVESGTSDYNMFTDNHIPGLFGKELTRIGANSWQRDNYGLQAATRERVWPLVVDASVTVQFEGHVEMDSSLTVEDTIWLGAGKTNPSITTNPGGENTRIGADANIQLVPNHDTQNTDYLEISYSGGNTLLGNNGAAAVWIQSPDHLSPFGDSTQALGHNANFSWRSLGLEPLAASDVNTLAHNEMLFLLDSDGDGDADSLCVMFSTTQYFRLAIDGIGTK